MKVAQLLESNKLSLTTRIVQKYLDDRKSVDIDFVAPGGQRVVGHIETLEIAPDQFGAGKGALLMLRYFDAFNRSGKVKARIVPDTFFGTLNIEPVKRMGRDCFKVVPSDETAAWNPQAAAWGSLEESVDYTDASIEPKVPLLVRILQNKLKAGVPMNVDLKYIWGSSFIAHWTGILVGISVNAPRGPQGSWADKEWTVNVTFRQPGSDRDKTVYRRMKTFDEVHDLLDDGDGEFTLKNTATYGEKES